jgi:hypothetical protein
MRSMQRVLCWTAILATCTSAFAVDTNLAVMYPRMTAWVNGAVAHDALVVFPEDLVQTEGDSVATIDCSGTNVIVQPNSLVKVAVNAVELQRGAIAVGTSKNVAARVGDVTIKPASSDWTQYAVSDVDGSVKIVARTGSVMILDDQGSSTLAAGQETTVDPSSSKDPEPSKKSKKKKRAGAAPGANSGILDTWQAAAVGSAAVLGVVTWVFLQREDPASPYKP